MSCFKMAIYSIQYSQYTGQNYMDNNIILITLPPYTTI